MKDVECIQRWCFAPLNATGPSIFGFSEFLAALALMVLAWTIADVRYRFRLRTAPLPLQGLTFVVITGVGVLALLTDLWRAESLPVLVGSLLSPAAWQALLGGLFLLCFITWVWFAFIFPPVFGRGNARRFALQIYRVVLKGSPIEMPEIADELARSAKSLIKHSWEFVDIHTPGVKSHHSVRRYAFDILQIIADRKFCRHVVQASPITALAIFDEADKQGRLGIPIDIFAKNITAEAIANRDSFAYHEVDGYFSGYVGHHKPLTTALYGNYDLVTALKQVFDVDYEDHKRWDASQWQAYCRLVEVTFKNYASFNGSADPAGFHRAFQIIGSSMRGVPREFAAVADWWVEDSVEKLHVVANFAAGVMRILDVHKPALRPEPRRSEHHSDIYDLIAELMFNVVLQASAVKAPSQVCWALHLHVINKFFEERGLGGQATGVVRHRLRRLIFDEIARMKKFPNYKGSRILGLMLNVSRLSSSDSEYQKAWRALRVSVLGWARQNYAQMAADSPRVAADCLVEGLEYDPSVPQLVLTGIPILDQPPPVTTLELMPPRE